MVKTELVIRVCVCVDRYVSLVGTQGGFAGEHKPIELSWCICKTRYYRSEIQ